MRDRVELWADIVGAGRAVEVCEAITRCRSARIDLLGVIARAEPPPCGSEYAYRLGCRCGPCKAAKAASKKPRYGR